MNRELRLAAGRNSSCQLCKLSGSLTPSETCRTGRGPTGAKVGVVTTFPLSEESRMRRELVNWIRGHTTIDTSGIVWLSALKCAPPEGNPTKTDMKACKPYLDRELRWLAEQGMTHVITFGTEALFATLGRSGIMKYRGRVEYLGSLAVFPTISPSMLSRNPGMTGGFIADLQYFNKMMMGDNLGEDPWHLPYDDQWTTVDTKDAIRSLVKDLRTADAASYDIETVGASAFASDARIVSLAITTLTGDTPHVWAIPLWHPGSVWQEKWRQILEILAKYLTRVPILIGHNAKYDTVWLNHFGMPDLSPTFDTIIAAALLDENRPKGLKPLAQQLLGADPWAVDTRSLLDMSIEDVLDYNGLDTWHTLRLYLLFREQLKKEPRLLRLFTRLMMPAIRELCHVETAGVYVDYHLMMRNWAEVQRTLSDIENQLHAHLPDPEDVPDHLKHKTTGEILVNYNASNFLRWWLFDFLGMPVLARGKAKDDGTPGAPSVAEAVMMALAPQYPVAKLLLDRVEWNKYHTAFFTPYAAQITEDSRIRTTFKPWGTVTGRLSSGKEDQEKITGRAQRRGVNLQQVPRNKLVRGVFGAPPGSLFVEADYSQIELRIAAFIAQERTMLNLYARGQDIHMAMAMRMTGKPQSQITSEERKKAKAVNFGFLYGMGWAKFIQTAFVNYGVTVTEEEAQAFRKAFFDQFPGLMTWHAKQRKLAGQFKRVETPLGRIRHLPDVDSANREVQGEAQRQAINSPVQGMASDMALLSLVHTARAFRKQGLAAAPIGTVHDAVNFEIRYDDVPRALPLIKHIMENLPLERLFDCQPLNVPIIADLKVGTHWGGATEVPVEVITSGPGEIQRWLKANMSFGTAESAARG
jgi:DNA polymerase I-like protein with 3'-5' exonuclease and polymerase domains/uracil-DNA glycosylase